MEISPDVYRPAPLARHLLLPPGVRELPADYGQSAPDDASSPAIRERDPRYEYWASLALRHTPGLGPRTWKGLLDAYGGAWSAVVRLADWHARGLAPVRVIQALRDGLWRERAEDEWRQAGEGGHHVLLHGHPRYPALLRAIPDPPLFLYYVGDLSLLESPGVAVVGSRRCTDYGRSMAVSLARDLARAGVTVVSGLAHGIDRHAHLAALDEAGSSIAVLGAGLDSGYPEGNRDVRELLEERGLVLSELAPQARPEPHQFPIRNRIVSGLSLAVVVAEAGLGSGGLITAARALEQNREVFAVPGQATSPGHAGCLRLIEDGARVATSAESILREIAPQLQERLRQAEAAPPRPSPPRALSAKSEKPESSVRSARSGSRHAAGPAPASQPAAAPEPFLEISDEERAVLEILPETGTLHIDELCQGLGWEVSRVSRALLGLEMAGAARQTPGARYQRLRPAQARP